MARRRNSKGRFVSGGKKKTKRKSTKRRNAARGRRRDSKGRFLKKGKKTSGRKKTKKGRKHTGAHKRKSKGRGRPAVGYCNPCGRHIFGGAKGMNTHRKRHH